MGLPPHATADSYWRRRADFTDVDIPGLLTELSRRLDWSERRVDLPAGRYETLLPPSAVADLMIYMAWTMEGRAGVGRYDVLRRADP